jgi:hypothetical protein
MKEKSERKESSCLAVAFYPKISYLIGYIKER